MVLPPQSLDGSPVPAVGINPFGRVDFPQITGAYLRCLRKKIGNHLGCSRLAQPRERSCQTLLRRIVGGNRRRRQLDAHGGIRCASGHHADMVIAQRSIGRIAPVVKLNHPLIPKGLLKCRPIPT